MKLKLFIPAAIATLAIASVSSAVNLQFTGTDLASPATGTIKVNGSSSSQISLGKLTFISGSTILKTFCVDAVSTLDKAPHAYSAMDLDLTANTNIAKAGRILAQGFASTTDKDRQAGMQLAIWSAVYDGGSAFNANGTNFKVSSVSSQTLAFASSYYTAGLNFNAANFKVTMFSTNLKGGQSQIGVSPVPEPATFAVVGIGLAGIARRRKTLKK